MSGSDDWEKPAPGTVLTIGNFDGVHIGHQKILRDVVERAAATGGRGDSLGTQKELLPAVLTFYPHPARVLRPEQAPSLLETLPQRLADFAAMGIGAALVLKFDAELAQVSADDFVKEYLVQAMRARAVLVGESFRFGHKQQGDVELLRELGRGWGFEVVIGASERWGDVVSSSAIREAVRGGRMEDARRMLGRPFALVGEIRPGTGKGRKLVVPTLNLTTEQETLLGPAYTSPRPCFRRDYRSVTNVGVRPTFDGKRLAIESNLFDFAGVAHRWADGSAFPAAPARRAEILRA